MTQELAENIKRLRELYGTGQGYRNLGEASRFAELTFETINELVQLVGEMNQYLVAAKLFIIHNELERLPTEAEESIGKLERTLTKSSPIAALVKGGL